MAQPQPPAPQAPQQWDPQFLAYVNQYLQQAAAATGGQYTPAPEPTPPLEWPEALHAISARVPWHSEVEQNRAHEGIGRLVATIHMLEQDLAAIRARLPVLAAPVTQAQQQVLDAAGQAPQQQTPQAPYGPPAPQAPPVPMPQYNPWAAAGIPQGQALITGPAPAGLPPFGPTGQPLIPPAQASPPPAATFGGAPYPGMPQVAPVG